MLAHFGRLRRCRCVLCIGIPRSPIAVSENAKERWQELCEQASIESDPEKLLELVTEINRLLEARHAGTMAPSAPSPTIHSEPQPGEWRPGPTSVRRFTSEPSPRKKTGGNAA